MEYYSLNRYLRDAFGEKLYKIAIDGGFTCPNRDGTLDSRGCIFCSGRGSGEFAESASLSVTEQIERGKARVAGKYRGSRYIAYFQAFTNTYAPVSRLRTLFEEAIAHPDVAVLSVATRPDCLPDDVIALLAGLNRRKPVWVELGLQTIHERTAAYIRRGYSLDVYDDAVRRLKEAGLDVITHVILGLPGETKEEMLETVRHVVQVSRDNCRNGRETGYPVRQDAAAISAPDHMRRQFSRAGTGADGIKLQLLHVLEGTDLAKEYRAGKVAVLSLEEYAILICECLALIRNDMIVHRITGDGDRRMLIAPLWSAGKKHVLNTLSRAISDW